MKELIVFSHMMKTGGSSFIKLLIEYFGLRFTSAPNRLSLSERAFNTEELKFLLKKKVLFPKVISGHPIRPFERINLDGIKLSYVTMMREPKSRFISHYFHDKYYRPGLFSKLPGEKTIIDWWKYHDYSNYQTRFLSGSYDVEKAKEILINKIDLALKMESMQESLSIFQNHFKLPGFPNHTVRVNKSQARRDEYEKIKLDFDDFIADQNQLDLSLYEFFLMEKWPGLLKYLDAKEFNEKTISSTQSQFNFWLYQVEKQILFSEGRVVNSRTIKRFLNRWKP